MASDGWGNAGGAGGNDSWGNAGGARGGYGQQSGGYGGQQRSTGCFNCGQGVFAAPCLRVTMAS